MPRLLQGPAVQRPRLPGRGDRQRMLADGHHADEGRPRDTGRPGRHAPTTGRSLPRAGHEALPGGHRGVGGARRRPTGPRRCPVAAHRPLGVPGRGGADAGDGGVGRIRDPVSGRARYRAPRGGLGARGAEQCAGTSRQSDPSLRHRRARHEPARQHRPRRGGRGRGPAEPLGVHDGGRAVAGARRHRISGESDRDLLTAAADGKALESPRSSPG